MGRGINLVGGCAATYFVFKLQRGHLLALLSLAKPRGPSQKSDYGGLQTDDIRKQLVSGSASLFTGMLADSL